MSSSGSGSCAGVIQTINLGISIAIIVYTARIYNATKETPYPFEKYTNNTYRLLLSSLETPTLKNDAKINMYCQCGDKFLSNICTEEQIISGCYDITPNEQKNLLRNLADQAFCNEIKTLRDAHTELSTIFNLDYVGVNKMALGILIICCGFLGVIGVLLLSVFCICCCQELGLCFLVTCAPIILIVVIVGGIADIVVFIIMLVKYYKGRTTGEFIQYYDDCEPADKDNLKPVYNVVKPIQGYMTAFVVLNCIGIFLNYLGAILNKQNSAQNQ